MKYDISNIQAAKTKDIDISSFFPDAKEKVFITIRRLTVKQKNEITAMMITGQKVNKEGTQVELGQSSWFVSVRAKELLYAVVQNETFPFAKWNENFINEIDERNPDFIQLLQTEIQAFNSPLAQRQSKN